MTGRVGGTADIKIEEYSDRKAINAVSVTYSDYTDDGRHFINGSEELRRVQGPDRVPTFLLRSDLRAHGAQNATKNEALRDLWRKRFCATSAPGQPPTSDSR